MISSKTKDTMGGDYSKGVYAQNFRKGFRRLALATGLTGLVLGLGGCATSGHNYQENESASDQFIDLIKETPFGIPIAVGERVFGGNKKVNVYVNNVHERREEYSFASNDPWRGTAVENKIKTEDGRVIFILDSHRVGRSIDSNYADRFIDEENYTKTWEWYKGKFGFIVTYTPKTQEKILTSKEIDDIVKRVFNDSEE